MAFRLQSKQESVPGTGGNGINQALKILFVVAAAILFVSVLGVALMSSTGPAALEPEKGNHLIAAGTTSTGIYVKNKDATAPMTACRVSLNGDGGFPECEDQPYSSLASFGLAPGEEITIPYSKIISEGGTRFDYLRQEILTLQVYCRCGSSGGAEDRWFFDYRK